MTFFLTLIFIFMVFWRPQEWLARGLYGWPILDVVVYIAVLTLALESQTGHVKFSKRSPQVWLLVMLWLAAIASQVVHAYLGGAIAAGQEVFKLCFFTLLLICVLDRPKRIRAVAVIFVAMACVMAVHAGLQQSRGYGFAGQFPIWQPPSDVRPGYMRSVFFGIFADPNDLSQCLATAIPLAFAMPKRMHIFSWIVAAGLTYFLARAMTFTHSRGGWVALITASAVMVCLLLPSRWLPYLLGAGLVGILLVCAFKGSVLIDVSAWERVEFWGYGNRAFKANPIFGIGHDMFWQISRGRPAHNAFVTCYTELGLFGYWPWFTLLLTGVMGCWRVRVATRGATDADARYLHRFSGLAIAATGGFAASAYFLSRAFVFPFFFLLAMTNAVPLMADRFVEGEHEPFISVKRDVFVMGTLGTILSIVYIYLSIVLLNRSMGG